MQVCRPYICTTCRIKTRPTTADRVICPLMIRTKNELKSTLCDTKCNLIKSIVLYIKLDQENKINIVHILTKLMYM